MLLLSSVRVAEIPHVWERAVIRFTVRITGLVNRMNSFLIFETEFILF